MDKLLALIKDLLTHLLVDRQFPADEGRLANKGMHPSSSFINGLLHLWCVLHLLDVFDILHFNCCHLFGKTESKAFPPP